MITEGANLFHAKFSHVDSPHMNFEGVKFYYVNLAGTNFVERAKLLGLKIEGIKRKIYYYKREELKNQNWTWD